jgi:DNA-binding transcriptional LysR family regulator
MPPHPPGNHPYKEITLQQLRSFCETILRGSFTAAAAALDLAHPTVWKQVHGLEHRLGVTLVEPHGRGCRPTEAGRLLARLASPLVTGIGSLECVFERSRAEAASRVVIAAPPRPLVEDLPECVVEFERRWPQVRVTLNQVRAEEVTAAVASGRADLGLTSNCLPDPDDPRLAFEPGYELEIVLVTPPDHPLARRRHLEARDLCAYPLVNALDSGENHVIRAALEELHTLGIQPSRVEAWDDAVICRYVQLGFGIGLLNRVCGHPPGTNLHLRSMSNVFGRPTVYLVRKKGDPCSGSAHGFAQTVKDLLSRPPADPDASSPGQRKSGAWSRRMGGIRAQRASERRLSFAPPDTTHSGQRHRTPRKRLR